MMNRGYARALPRRKQIDAYIYRVLVFAHIGRCGLDCALNLFRAIRERRRSLSLSLSRYERMESLWRRLVGLVNLLLLWYVSGFIEDAGDIVRL